MDTGFSVFVDNNDNIILAGYFGYQINQIYIAKFAPSGSVASGAPIWAKRYGGVGAETLYSAGLDRNGDLVLGGMFKTQTDLGSGTIQGTGFDSDMFLAK